MVVVLLVVVLGIGTASLRAAGGDAHIPSRRLGHVRIERTFRFDPQWEASCEHGSCGIPEIVSLRLRTPASAEHVDIVASVTLDYTTGPGADDFVTAQAFLSRQGDRPFNAMAPRKFPLTSPSRSARSSSTLTWVERQLAARSRTYVFEIDVSPRDGDGDEVVVASGTRVTVVLDIWPAGS